MTNIDRPRVLSTALLPAAAVTLTCLAYANCLTNGFVFDDSAYLTSPAVRDFDLARLATDNWRDLALYRPLALVSLAVDQALWHGRAAGFHLTSVALHGAVTWLVWWLARQLAVGRAGSLVAALVFGLHPVQSEVVNWISARGDLLAAALVLLGLGAHLRAGDSRALGGAPWRWLAVACCALAPVAKETGATFAVAAWWLDRTRTPERAASPLPRFTAAWLRRHWQYPLALAVVAAARTAVVAAGGEPPHSANPLAAASLPERAATALAILGRCVALVALPRGLSADYSFDSIPLSSAADPWLYAGIGVVAGLGFAAARGRPLSAFAAGAFLIAWLPVSNLVFLAPSAMAERYLYPGFHAVALAVGAGAGRLLDGAGTRRSLTAIGLVLLLASWSVAVPLRNRDWRDDGTLFAAVRDRFPRNARALENLGHWHARQGDLDRAVDLYREALVVRAQNPRALSSLGALELRRGRLPEAAVAFAGAVTLDPRHLPALLDLAGTLERLGRQAEAAARYRQVLALVPEHAAARAGLARVAPSGQIP